MDSLEKPQQELGAEALVSVAKNTFNLLLSTSRHCLVDTMNGLIERGELIIWNPRTAELLSAGDIVKATVSGKTVTISLAKKNKPNFKEWFESS